MRQCFGKVFSKNSDSIATIITYRDLLSVSDHLRWVEDTQIQIQLGQNLTLSTSIACSNSRLNPYVRGCESRRKLYSHFILSKPSLNSALFSLQPDSCGNHDTPRRLLKHSGGREGRGPAKPSLF